MRGSVMGRNKARRNVLSERDRMRPANMWQFSVPGARPALWFAGLLLLAGCGDGKVARYPVTGVVTVDGKAAPDATVMFYPVNVPAEAMKERPFSQTDSSGKYELRTLMPGDGAPAGEYKVTIRWLAASPGGGQPIDRLGNRYWDPEKTSLTAKIEKGNNDIPFQLSAKGK
jgi:hypothetical protein